MMRTYQIDQRELVESPTAVVRARLSVTEIGPFVGSAIASVASELARQSVSPAGPPYARYHRLDGGMFDVEVGFRAAAAALPRGDDSVSSLPGGLAAVLAYVGPYDEMEAAYGALAEWVSSRGGEANGDPWEVYLSDPAQEPDPRRWRTEIVMPFRVGPSPA